MKNNLENLEIKLAQTKKENAEKLDKIESEFKEKYSELFDIVLKNDNLWFKRYISVNFQLDKLDNPEKSDFEILKNSISKALEILPLNQEKKENLKDKLILLAKASSWQVEMWTEGFSSLNMSEIFRKNNDLRKDKNYPILEDLKKYWVLDENDLIQINLKYKETHNFLDSIFVLSENKKEIVKHNYFELNNTKSQDRIESFENDFSSEIKNSKLLQIYPKVLKFIWKNYFKLRLKNKVESKKDRLRRLYKIAFLKLYRLKYSWIDIDKLLKKIDSISDFDEFISLIIKYFEVLKQNPNLQKDFLVSEEVEDVENALSEAEDNKEKILFSEKNTIKVNEIFEEHDKKIGEENLEELLSDNVYLVWRNFIKREEISSWILAESDNIEEEDDDDEEENNKIADIDKYYEVLKAEYDDLEKKKQKLFLEGNYDLLDNLNEELLLILKKLEKLELLSWFEEDN